MSDSTCAACEFDNTQKDAHLCSNCGVVLRLAAIDVRLYKQIEYVNWKIEHHKNDAGYEDVDLKSFYALATLEQIQGTSKTKVMYDSAFEEQRIAEQ